MRSPAPGHDAEHPAGALAGPRRVLVVDDSPVALQLVCSLLDAAPGVVVVGTAVDGERAIEAVARLRPDVVTMDLHMPGLDGFETTRRLMRSHPVPIVVVSAAVGDEAKASFDALEAGALALVPRPSAPGTPGFERQCADLVETVRLMADVRVVRRSPVRGRHASPPPPRRGVAAVGIGASTGGPPQIERLLSGLRPGFRAPILVVQHMIEDFVPGFVNWLNRGSALPVCIPAHGDPLMPGRVYVAPGGRHLRVVGGRLSLGADPPIGGHRPSATALFASLAAEFGAAAVGILLSGMGRDGLDGFAALAASGATTVAQDAGSSVVWGMPGAAVAAGLARHVLAPASIGDLLGRLAGDTPRRAPVSGAREDGGEP